MKKKASDCQDFLELTGMRFLACHGCLPEEKTSPQPFVVDATIFLPLKSAGERDDIALSVDYTAVYTETQNIVTGESVNLIETLTEKIAQRILDKFPPVQKVRVTVHKPESPFAENIADVKTTVERSRNHA